jgi:hypothetical protein
MVLALAASLIAFGVCPHRTHAHEVMDEAGRVNVAEHLPAACATPSIACCKVDVIPQACTDKELHSHMYQGNRPSVTLLLPGAGASFDICGSLLHVPSPKIPSLPLESNRPTRSGLRPGTLPLRL